MNLNLIVDDADFGFTVHFVPQAEARGGGPAGDGGSQEVSGGDGPETGRAGSEAQVQPCASGRGRRP